MTAASRDRWQAWLVAAGAALLAIGFVAERMWRDIPWAHVRELALITFAAAVPTWLAGRFRRIGAAHSLLAVFAIALACFAGVQAALAVLLLATAAFALGSALVGDGEILVATIAGLAALVGVVGWLLPFPLHRPAAYVVVFLAIVLLRRRVVAAAVRRLHSAWCTAVQAEPRLAAFAVFVAGLASVGCWIPTVQFDDLAYHLGLPSQLAAVGYYRMDVQSQIWALAPWGGDVVQALAEVLAGTEARGAVDAFWLIAAAALVWRLAAALQLPLYGRFLASALFASQPLMASLAGGMQAELPAVAAVLALALTVANAKPVPERGDVLTVALLAGFLLALKTGFVALELPLLACAVWCWRRKLSARGIALSVLSALAVGGSSYVYAEMLTGNPLLPLMNAVFRSPYYAIENLHDPHWLAPLGWNLPWNLTFHTSAYAESWDGTAGFWLVGLLGAVPVALALRRTRWLAACALLSFAAAILTVHYYRYSFPALTLLAAALVAAVVGCMSRRTAICFLGALAVLGLVYQGTAFWTLHDGAVTKEVSALSVAPVFEHFAPERALIATVRELDSDAHVFLCTPEAPFAAELAGKGFAAAWYDPEFERARDLANLDGTGAGWHAMFARAGAHYAIVTAGTASPALQAALSSATLRRRVGSAELWELADTPAPAVDLTHERDQAARRFQP
ncbi:MAG TPA: hypothetical protein VFB32_08175 [Rudaea sp.]|nr:hypothetical protein [Rudaea sp.]